MATQGDWVGAARRELIGSRSPNGSWAYRKGASGSVEPTALAALALGAAGERAGQTAGWLTRLQNPDGSLGLSEKQAAPGWMTPYAMLLWDATGAHPEPTRRAAEWLLRLKGKVVPLSEDPARVIGHDSTLVGWPWVAETHSWLEPTVLAVLALSRAGFGDHPRVAAGLRLIRDRAIDGGGWNYGNKSVFGRPLRAQPAPTGLALLALAGIDARPGLVDAAIAYLRRTLPGVRAPSSLGWGLIGLAAWGEAPEESGGWLAESHGAVAGNQGAAIQLATLLLAAEPCAPRLFGRDPYRAEGLCFETVDGEAFEERGSHGDRR